MTSQSTPSLSSCSSAQSATCSRSSSPDLALDPATLALLDSFLDEKAEEERQFQQLSLKAKSHFQGSWEIQTDEERDEETQEDESRMISVDEYRKIFSEKFGMSQFCAVIALQPVSIRYIFNRYSTPFAELFARSILSICTPSTRVAFVCSPTGYVAFQGLPRPLPRTLLFEYDDRFAVLPVVPGEGQERRGYVHYDLYEPEMIPKDLEGSVEVVVVDPPYLNEKTNALIAATLRLVLAPSAKLILLTSTSVSFEALSRVYTMPQLGPLREVKGGAVKHHGGRFQNDYGVWASWDGGEDLMLEGHIG